MLRPWIQFRDLEAGDRFTFAHGWPPRPDDEAPLLEKEKGRWYRDEKGRRFQAAPNSAVTPRIGDEDR